MTESLTFDQLSTLFHMPLSDAAKQIGICCTALKKACRKNNISRWPHRKIKSLDRMIETLELKLEEVGDNDEIDKTRVELEYYRNQRALIMKNNPKNGGMELKMQKSNAISKTSSRSNNIHLSSPSSSSPSTVPSPQVFSFKPSSPSSGSSSSSSSHPVSPASLECSFLGIPTNDFDLFLDNQTPTPMTGAVFPHQSPFPAPSQLPAAIPSGVSATLPPSSNGIYFYPPQVDQKGYPYVHPQFVYNFTGFPSGNQQTPSLPMMAFPPNANFLVPFGYPVQFGASFGNNDSLPSNSSLTFSPLSFTAPQSNPSTSSVITTVETPSSPNFVPNHPENLYDNPFPSDFIFCQ